MSKQTDRELLELAALVAGLKPFKAWGKTFVMGDGSPPKPEWNPLTGDGDALRLAVKLSINIVPNYHAEWHFSVGGNFKAGREFTTECEVQADPYAATRRAIVRAAAQVGQSIQGVI